MKDLVDFVRACAYNRPMNTTTAPAPTIGSDVQIKINARPQLASFRGVAGTVTGLRPGTTEPLIVSTAEGTVTVRRSDLV